LTNIRAYQKLAGLNEPSESKYGGVCNDYVLRGQDRCKKFKLKKLLKLYFTSTGEGVYRYLI
jgi:hypothetical protein